tara:strand:- start:147 stop:419 length:273 start_codon:yes stop_codon:yes gene_type:complete
MDLNAETKLDFLVLKQAIRDCGSKDIDISSKALSYFISNDFKKLAKRIYIDANMVRGAVESLSAYPLLSRKKLANDMAKEIDVVWIKRVS